MVTGLDVPLQCKLKRSNMKFSVHNTASGSQWDDYQELELIPSESNPAHRKHYLTSWLNVVWRPLLALLMDELVEEQRVDYLDRCWSLQASSDGDRSSSNSLRRFWKLINWQQAEFIAICCWSSRRVQAGPSTSSASALSCRSPCVRYADLDRSSRSWRSDMDLRWICRRFECLYRSSESFSSCGHRHIYRCTK